MRQLLAVAAGAVTAAAGGLVVGEYPFTGAMPYLAGALFGLVVAEVMVGIAGHATRGLGGWSAVLGAAGLGYAARIDSGFGLHSIGAGAWAGVAIAAAVAGLRAGLRPRRSGVGDDQDVAVAVRHHDQAHHLGIVGRAEAEDVGRLAPPAETGGVDG